MSVIESPILSITIPTWNRAKFLTETIRQLASELKSIESLAVEILISDNASIDETEDVVAYWVNKGVALRYVRNSENIGSDANIAQCFNLAKGKYVLILGDDDVFVDGALKTLLGLLNGCNYGVVCMRSYGYDDNYRAEFPGGNGGAVLYSQVDDFFNKLGPLITLISVCVINKQLLQNLDASTFCGGNLVQVHLVARASILAECNVYFDQYMIACKRNNSGGYNFAKVFVDNLFGIMDEYKGDIFTSRGLSRLESRMIISFYPFYLYKSRVYGDGGSLNNDRLIYTARFKGRWEYDLVLHPILYWPRPLAVAWGALMTFAGRIAYGDMRRGFAFIVNKIRILSTFRTS